MDFTAIDVETAQGARWSICQIGIVRVENDEIVQEFSCLVKPPNNQYSDINTKIHNIRSEDTENEKSFNEVWPEIKHFIENQLIVAHNAMFDVDAILKTLDYYHIEKPQFTYECTYLSTGFRLIDICTTYEIQIDHHNAISDAIACAKIFLLLKSGNFDSSKIVPSKRKNLNLSNHPSINKEYLEPDFSKGDVNGVFYQKKVVITGIFNNFSRNRLAEILKNNGADINTSISSKTSFVIAGKEPGPSKLAKVEQLNLLGCSINVITEDDFLKMLD